MGADLARISRSMGRVMRSLTLSALVTLLAAIPSAAQEMFVVSGTISGPSGPLAGTPVEVRARAEFGEDLLLDTTVTSNSSGAFQVGVPASRIDLRATPPPHLDLDEAVVFNLPVKANVSVRLTTAPLVTLAGEVILPAGAPAPHSIDIYSLTSDRRQGSFLNGTRFEARVRSDVYSLQVRSGNGTVAGRVNVDATAADARNIVLEARSIDETNPFQIRLSPRGDLISVSPADDEGNAVVTGAPGAVEPLSAVLLGNVQTGQIKLVTSGADGGFSAPLFAPPGSPVMIRHDPTGHHLPFLTVGGQANVSINHAPGTTVYVPLPAGRFASSGSNVSGAPQESLQLSAARSTGVFDRGVWHLSGSLPADPIAPGRSVAVTGTLTLYLRDIRTAEEAATLRVTSNTDLEQVVDGEGLQRRPHNEFVSTYMTPSGLPIERRGHTGSLGPGQVGPLRFVRPGVVDAPWSLNAFLDPATPPGIYRTLLRVQVSGMPALSRQFEILPFMGFISGLSGVLPLIRVGSVPPRLVWMLGLDHFSNGSRGAVAVEDRGRVGISSKVMTNGERMIVPLRDSRTGELARFRLDPYLPLLSVTTGNGGIPEAPHVPFRLPSGSLTATIRKPDGSIDTIGPAPFVQLSYRTPVSRTGLTLTAASNHVSDFHQLMTGDPQFEITFSQWGRHVITLQGNVEDIYGHTYEGSGTYEIDVANLIDIDTAVIPGTPFNVAAAFSSALALAPPVPANVKLTIRRYPPSGAVESEDVRGFANRFGHFNGTPVRPGGEGEYRTDVEASWIDPDGVHWAGSATWGGVVETPGSRLITHGRRGFDLVDRIQDQWLFVKESRAGGDHLMFPFHAGDVMWMSKDDPAAHIPKITIQDPEGAFAQRVRSRMTFPGAAWESPAIEDRITAGEIPLFSTKPRRAFDAPVEQWGYFYGAVSRPGVRVREFISEDQSSSGYWRFHDAYNLQLGNGIHGDLPNDFKFQFGGAVWRDLTDGFHHYGGYASLFVLLPMNDDPGGRLLPPFQGNGGGPDGGPLFTLKGRAINLFFHPTGVRPGTILHHGERASFAGYSAPTLPSKIEIVVTSPSGATRTIRGQASAIGWFYDPSQDFVVDEPGVWRAKVKILFDGRTSAGQVTEPFPTGDVLGSREGEFWFYVVGSRSAQLEIANVSQAATTVLLNRDSPPSHDHAAFMRAASVSLLSEWPATPRARRGHSESPAVPALDDGEVRAGNDAMRTFVRPADGPVTFTITPPPGLTNVEMYVTATMPGFILEEKRQTSLTYSYDAPRLAQDFPNLDLHDADGFAGADTITISFLVSGTDVTGALRYHARQIAIQGEELQMPDQHPRPKRRAAR